MAEELPIKLVLERINSSFQSKFRASELFHEQQQKNDSEIVAKKSEGKLWEISNISQQNIIRKSPQKNPKVWDLKFNSVLQ